MTVTRVRETPRTTKPYTEEQWATLLKVGEAIERDIGKHDVRLTMGGEPTFVSVDDMDGPEWNTLALGPEKRRLAGVLFRKLAHRFATGPLLHFGQGKWYPGEQLPRWALGCYWRKDGEPIWRNPQLYALESKPVGATVEAAHRFALAFAQRLQLDPDYLFPAYEDTWYYLLARAAAAQQRRGRRGQGEGSAGARAPGARLREGPRKLGRLRAAG